MRRTTVPLLSLAVGVVLSDSAIVTLALPQILRELDTSVGQVAWVLIAFNLVLALLAVPAARVCLRHDPASVCAVGIVTFAAASAACALAQSIGVLIVARCVQAAGGAFVVLTCLELLVVARGSERRGLTRWVGAGVVGAAAGPVVGGLLTAAVSWQSIFAVQVPLTLAALPVLRPLRGAGETRRGAGEHPQVRANLALALLSAAVTAGLFLLVLLMVEGWRRSPAVAAVTVTVVPVAAAAARPLSRRAGAGPRAEIVAGSVLLGGGLVALALLPAARLAWTVAPQALLGLGLGLTIDSLTLSALQARELRVLQGGWTIGARHAGVVVGLAILTPVFTSDLRAAQTPAKEAVAGLVLDARLPAQIKVDLAEGLARRLQEEHGRVPDLHPAFASLPVRGAQRRTAQHLEHQLDEQLQRAATAAFRDAFLIAGGLALLVLLVVPADPRVVRS